MNRIKVLSVTVASFLVVIMILLTGTCSALFVSKSAEGIVEFNRNYTLTVSSSNTNILQSNNIKITHNVASGDVQANIQLSKDSESNDKINSINNNTITGNFYKYNWGIDELNLNNESLMFNVYAQNNYVFYPKLDITIKYKGDGLSVVHLGVNTTQDIIYTVSSSNGTYYSYLIEVDNYKYLLTYPNISQMQDGYVVRQVTCLILDNNGEPVSIVGQGNEIVSYQLKIEDLINGIYFDQNYAYDTSLEITFSIKPSFN